jgi:UDP-hydrolysing UDP-N-acetyl-D-glucosamine 2-epimerase
MSQRMRHCRKPTWKPDRDRFFRIEIMKRKVCVVITARPSYSRIKTALRAIQEHPDLELQLVVAASALLDRYGSAYQLIEKDGFKINASVYMVVEGENLPTMAKSTGIGLMELSTVFDNLKPHLVITIADRYETIATAIAAAYMNIPLVHIQGGEVTGSIDEKVRHAITKLADHHLVSNQTAADRVTRMGENPASIHVTGCPSIDLAAEVLASPALDFDPFKKYGGVGTLHELKGDYIVVMQHPVTTEYQKAREHVEETFHAVMDLKVPTLWFWPNVDAGSDGTSKGLRSLRERYALDNMHFFRNMTGTDFLRLLYNSRCLIGNSSVGIRECSFLGVPVVNIGSRQDKRDRGHNVMDTGYGRAEIHAAAARQVKAGRYPNDHVYGDGHAGKKIADKLASVPLVFEKRLTY